MASDDDTRNFALREDVASLALDTRSKHIRHLAVPFSDLEVEFGGELLAEFQRDFGVAGE